MQPRLPFDSHEAPPHVAPTHHGPRHDLVYVFVRHPRARRYIIRVADERTVRVTVPRWGSKREAAAFAVQERAWIDKQIARARTAILETSTATNDPDEGGGQALAAAHEHARARRELPARTFELAAQYGLTVSKVSVRNQRWRWGSCSPSGHICLNWRLVQMPDWVRDYVIVHELMHLKRMDHSPKFWKLVAAVCPEYKQARAWLRKAAR